MNQGRSSHTAGSRREAGKARVPIVMALAAVVAAAVSALFISQPWGAQAGIPQDPVHGIGFAKGCSVTPAVVGGPYTCRYLINNNNDQALDTLHTWHRKRWVYIEGTKVIALAVREQPSAYRTPPSKGTPRRARPPVPLTLTARP